jgi:teichuronic acid biosynthesis glycosyltransferase TuaH
VAALIGQLNDRLDLDALERTVAAGVPLRVIGRLVAQDPVFHARLERFLASPGVEWRGEIRPDQLPAELARVAVGLTPYADTAFNRSSFPLKTLDYLAAGAPVVSTELSASRWFESPDVRVAADADAFAALALAAVRAPADAARDASCRALAVAHGWDRRAADLEELVTALDASGAGVSAPGRA